MGRGKKEGEKGRQRERGRASFFNEVLFTFQHAVTFLVISSSEISLQGPYRPLPSPTFPNYLASGQVHIPGQASEVHPNTSWSPISREEEGGFGVGEAWSPQPPSPTFLWLLPPGMVSVSKIALGTDKTLVTRSNQLPLDRKENGFSIISYCASVEGVGEENQKINKCGWEGWHTHTGEEGW